MQLPPPRRDDRRGLDQYVNRIIISARLLTNEDLVTCAPHQSTSDKAPISDTPVCLRCIFFAGDNSSLWNVKIARKRAGEQGDALETVNVVGGDVYANLP